VGGSRARRWWTRKSALFAIASAVVMASVGVVIAFAQAGVMGAPVMTPGPGATIGLSWETVAPIGANDTTYTLSYDTTHPFTAPQTIVTTDTFATISGVDGITYYAIIQADEGSGVLSDPSPVAQETADGLAPLSTFVAVPASPNGLNEWYTDPSTAATISIEETNSGLESFVVNGLDVSGGFTIAIAPDPSFYPVPTLAQGVNTFSFFGTDVAGNIESPAKTATVKLDSVSPTCTLSVSASGPTSQPITATIKAGDAPPGSGFDHIDYVFLPQGTWPQFSTVSSVSVDPSMTITVPEGRLTLFVRSVDVAGNISLNPHTDVFFDSTAPVTDIVTNPASPTGPSGSWLHVPLVELVVTDADPNTTTFYSWNTPDTISTVGTSPVVPTGPGVQTLRYLTVDTAGNREATKTATFLVQDQQTYTLAYTAGIGGSIVGSSTQVVSGGSDGTTVTATPATGYHFVSWSDGVLTAARQDLNVTANVTVTASFAINTYTLAYTAGLHGSIVGSSTQVVDYGSNGTTVTATPATGYHFVSWSDGVLTAARRDMGVTANLTVSASFAINTYTLSYSAGTGGSIVGSSTQVVDYGSNGTTVTATPATGYHFVSWSDGVLTAARQDTNVTANVTVSATFAIDTHTLAYTAGLHGSIVGSATQVVNYGANGTTVTATPATGYHFVSWSDGVLTAARRDMNVIVDVSASASFAINTYTLSYSAGANGSIVGSATQVVNYGSNGTLVTATPATGYHFVSWSDGVLTAARTDTNVTANLSVSASFAINTYTLTYSAGAHGTITGVSPQTVNYGSDGMLVTAVPASGYHFVSWSDGVTTAARTDTNVTADVDVTASFASTVYTLTYSAGAHGSIVGASPQTVASGGDGVLVTAVPATGYHFVSWSDGVLTAARQELNVTANVTVGASFAVNTYTLTYSAGAHGSITGASPQTVGYGSDGTLVTAVPASGYHFVSWSDGLLTAARTDINVTAAVDVTASFAFTLVPTRVTINANHTSVLAGHRVYFWGVVVPNRVNGTKVEFWVRKSGSTWRRVTLRRTFSSHHWSYYYHPATRGTYYFKAGLWATSRYAASRSRYIKVIWR
jgi:hypothetical protein